MAEQRNEQRPSALRAQQPAHTRAPRMPERSDVNEVARRDDPMALERDDEWLRDDRDLSW